MPPEANNHETAPMTQALAIKTVLHVGCGTFAPEKLHPAFRGPEWRELRLDIDPATKPDILANLLDMSAVRTAEVDAVYSSHNLEHLYTHEVPLALREIRRVLRPEGMAVITLPDLQAVAERIVADGLESTAYQSPAGPIRPIDILYGFEPALAAGNLFMAHRTGFTARSLGNALLAAGFATVTLQRNPPAFSLWAVAFVRSPDDVQLAAAQRALFPLSVE